VTENLHQTSGLRLDRVRSFSSQWRQAILLGLLTVGAYGFSYYSFGVFLEPISTDTGWSKGGLSGAFALGTIIGGSGGLVAGRVLDARGPRPVFITGLTAGSLLILFASSTSSFLTFALAWGAGAGAISACLFYNTTMATTSRLYPGDRATAFTVLTFVGGFALPIFGPLSGFIIDEWGWRPGMRILLVVQALLVMPAILFISGDPRTGAKKTQESETAGYGSIREAIRSREVVQMTTMFAFGIAAVSAIQVHHVAAFRATGLSLGAAATIAGFRGIMSLPGRATLALVQGRLGTAGATLAVYMLLAIGTLLLIPAGSLVFVLVFATITGFVFGTVVPLQGLYSAEILGDRKLGTLLGAQAIVLTLAGASGPLLIGLVADASNSYQPALALIVALHAVAILLLLTRPRHPEQGLRSFQAASNTPSGAQP
jgi:MFS family permease